MEAPEPAAPPEQPEPPVAQQPEPPPTPDPAPTPVVKPRPIALTAKLVSSVMGKSTHKLLACGDQFRSELPAGRVMLQLKIKHTGEVREAKVSEPASLARGLAQCLESRAKGIKFPVNNNNPEFAIQIPMRFNEAN